MKKRPTRKKKKHVGDKYFETRREAFRWSKRDNQIEVNQHPEEVITPKHENWDNYDLDTGRNRRLYRFLINVLNKLTGFFEEKEIHIREDKDYTYSSKSTKGNQIEHFNSGESKDNKLRKHHYYKRKNKR